MSPLATPDLTERELDQAFGALSDPTRRAILARLAEGEAGVLEVAAPFPMSQPAVTKHLNVLEDAGLISRHRRARQRLCRLEPVRLKQLSDWVGSYREFWEESFERLDELLEDLQSAHEIDQSKKQKQKQKQNKTKGEAR
jgi:DNA-binding transcriptional ArsR family regulator